VKNAAIHPVQFYGAGIVIGAAQSKPAFAGRKVKENAAELVLVSPHLRKEKDLFTVDHGAGGGIIKNARHISAAGCCCGQCCWAGSLHLFEDSPPRDA
jgi:hypothetical protein